MNRYIGITAIFASVCVLLALISKPLFARDYSSHYVTTWTSSPQAVWKDDFIFPKNIPDSLENQTVRQAIRLSLGGSHFRIELSNVHGNEPIKVGNVTIGIPQSSNNVYELERTVSVTFGGEKEATIQPGAVLLSDVISLTLQSLSNIVISAYLPEKTHIETFHWDGRQSNFIVAGDQTQALRLDSKSYKTTARLLISGLYVHNETGRAIAVLGDSITDGATASLDKNTRWTDFLAERLEANNVAVFNAGISGARLLSDGMGSNGLSRLNRDITSKPGVSSLIVLLGINDIAWPGTLFAPTEKSPSLSDLVSGFTQLSNQAHLQGIRIFVATLPPFKGALSNTPLDNYFNNDKNELRLALNDWIRSTDAFDGFIDFDQILRNEEKPNEIYKEYDSGDHLHPGDKGNKAMAYGIDINMLLNQRKGNQSQIGVKK